MALAATKEREDQDRRRVRQRTADAAALERNSLKSELDNYGSYFSADERKTVVKAIQILEKLMAIE